MRCRGRLRYREVVLIGEVDDLEDEPRRLSELLREAKTVGAVLTDPQVQVDAVDRVAEMGEDVPKGQAVLATRDS